MGMTTMSSSGIAAAPPLSQLGLAAQANAMQNQGFGQAQLAQQYTQAQMQAMSLGLARQQHKYMINGRTMNFDQFLNELCPDADDPMRTFLTLKYKGMEK